MRRPNLTRLTLNACVLLAAQALFQISHASDFQAILTCENGSVWVDVNTRNRDELQFVSRHRDANRHITKTLRAHTTYQNGQDYEAGWIGRQSDGLVHSPGDFRGATMHIERPNSAAPIQLNGEYVRGFKEFVSFYMINESTLKLQVDRRELTKCIDNEYNGRFGVCAKGTHYVDYQYVGDYYFNGCQKL